MASVFLALGVYVFLLGAQCLAVDRFILKSRLPPTKAENAIFSSAEPKLGPNRVVAPREYSPWIFMSLGAVVCGYSFTLPRRWTAKK